MASGRWSFGPFEFDAGRYRLARDGEELFVQPKPLDLLARLLQSPGDLVEREALERALYPDVTVTSNALRNVILKLREALGPDHEGWVETVPRRGVRFVGPVVVEGQRPGDGPSQARFGYHLPAERDRFVGRAADLEDLASAIEASRLVTLLGAGGVGKTRLALRCAWSVRERWPGGVWFCDLTDARTPDEAAAAAARALDLPLAADPLAQLGHAIAARGRCLVILDNFEQLVSWAQPIAGAWSERAPEARFLVTSRDRLRLAGERLFDLGPLSQQDGEALFVERARAAHRRFVAPETGEIGALVEMLDALPLAIELAAERVRVMPLAEITARMADRFALLSSGPSGGRPPRHAALRAVLDDSWELLSAGERRALAWLSVFEGGFALDAAESLLGASEGWPIDLVQRLVDQSLVRAVLDSRLELLASVRAYAAERLRGLGEAHEAESHHGALFAERADALFGQPDALERLSPERSNLVIACRRAISRGDLRCAVAALRGVWAIVEAQGPLALGYDLAREALAADPEDGWAAWVCGQAAEAMGRSEEGDALLAEALARAERGLDRTLVACLQRARVVVLLGRGRFEEARPLIRAALDEIGVDSGSILVPRLFMSLAEIDRLTGAPERARSGYEAALEGARAMGDKRCETFALAGLGAVSHYYLGDLGRARARYEEALALAKQRGAPRDEGRLLGHLAGLCDAEARYEDALACLEEALAVHRRLGDRLEEGIDLGRLGLLHTRGRSPQRAQPFFEAALAIQRELGNRREEGVVLGNLGSMWAALDHPRRARACLEEALAIHQESNNRRFEGLVSCALAEGYLAEGDLERARLWLDRTLSLHEEMGNRVERAYTLGLMATLHLRRDDIAAAALLAGEGARVLREIGDRRDLPLLLCICAEVEAAAGRRRAALALADEAEAIASGSYHADLDARIARIKVESEVGNRRA